MKTKKIFLAGAMGVAGIGLAGCGGSGSTSAIVDALYAEDVGTVAEALDDGKTLTAHSGELSKAARRADPGDGDNVWTDVASQEFTIKKNNQGGVDVAVDGLTVSYTPDDLKIEDNPDDGPYGWEKNDESGNHGVFTWSAPSAEGALSGEAEFDHHQVWSYFWNTEEGETLNGMAVVGTEAKASALENKANATYRGWAVVDTYEKGSESFDRVRVAGDVEMTARFDEGKISGSLDDLATRERIDDNWTTDGYVPIAGSVSMDETDIKGNAFSGTLTPDAALVAEVGEFDGDYSGRFFGPNGEEVGGVLSVEGEDAVGSGFFTAGQVD